MLDGYTSNIMTSMIPIAALFLILIIALIYKRTRRASQNNKSAEANAIIEAQAMLAKMQKEKESKESEKKDDSKNEEPTKEAENKPESSNKESGEKKEEEKKDEASKKPQAEAPIEDTTELEPDIDKSIEE